MAWPRVTNRRKARVLSLVAVGLGLGATSFSIFDRHSLLFVVSTVFFFGMTCALAGVTWWETREK